MIANPRGLWQTIAQSGGQIVAVVRRLRQDEAAGAETAVTFHLPFANKWQVVNGGVTQESSHSWSLLSQRYAYDFFITDASGQSYSGSGAKPEDYHCFSQPILAAADGEVVALRDDVADYGRAGSCWIDWRTRDIRGNYITIRHAPGVYSLSAHLQHGSLQVAVGDKVQRGQPIARCGHSGHSTEPHLHFQVQDHPDFFLALGQPIRFAHFIQQANDDEALTAVQSGHLTKDHHVWQTAVADGLTMPVPAAQVGRGELLSTVGNFVLGLVGITYLFSQIIGWLMRLLTL